MNEPARKRSIDRILVALDPCVQSFAALESAATLAERAQAELIALFIEDLNLIHLAGLPFARELDRTSGAARALDGPQMARALRAQAEHARQTLERVAKQRRIRTTLKVVRGHYITEALSASTGMDVSFLHRGQRTRLADPSPMRISILAARRRIDERRPVWVFYDGSPGAAHALELAKELTVPEEKDLIVLLPETSADATKSLERKAIDALGDRGPSARFRKAPTDDVSELSKTMRKEGCSLLLMSRDNALLTERSAQSLIDDVDCPVVLASSCPCS